MGDLWIPQQKEGYGVTLGETFEYYKRGGVYTFDISQGDLWVPQWRGGNGIILERLVHVDTTAH